MLGLLPPLRQDASVDLTGGLSAPLNPDVRFVHCPRSQGRPSAPREGCTAPVKVWGVRTSCETGRGGSLPCEMESCVKPTEMERIKPASLEAIYFLGQPLFYPSHLLTASFVLSSDRNFQPSDMKLFPSFFPDFQLLVTCQYRVQLFPLLC